MLMRADSKLLKAILFINSPTEKLPQLFPLWVMAVRVGNDYTTMVNVTFNPQ